MRQQPAADERQGGDHGASHGVGALGVGALARMTERSEAACLADARQLRVDVEIRERRDLGQRAGDFGARGVEVLLDPGTGRAQRLVEGGAVGSHRRDARREQQQLEVLPPQRVLLLRDQPGGRGLDAPQRHEVARSLPDAPPGARQWAVLLDLRAGAPHFRHRHADDRQRGDGILEPADARQDLRQVRPLHGAQPGDLRAELGPHLAHRRVVERGQPSVGRLHRGDRRLDVAFELDAPLGQLEQVQRLGAHPRALRRLGAGPQFLDAAAEFLDLRGHLAQARAARCATWRGSTRGPP